MTLRHLLIQRAARLQGRLALTGPEWGTLNYSQLRNRVEGIALGLMAEVPSPGSPVYAATGTLWDWGAELAAACCGLVWDPNGKIVDRAIFGGPRFNDEDGRQSYHDREELVQENTRFYGKLTHQQFFERLAQLNRHLGWDHTTEVPLPLDQFNTLAMRGALWSVLYGGSHAMLLDPHKASPKGLLRRWFGAKPEVIRWDPAPFEALWLEGVKSFSQSPSV